MKVRHAIALSALLTATTMLPTPTAGAHVDASPVVTVINSTALDGLGSGSTVGPDGALYVTNGSAGTLVRINPRTGNASVVGSGLPPQLVGIGGAMDAVFWRGRAYALVTLAGADIGNPAAVMGIYRLDDNGHFEPFADIGSWAAAHPPVDPDWFLSQGVQYALDVWRDDLIVTDAHHARVIRVDRHGSVSELLAFPSTNAVPTGIDSSHGKVYLATAGPIPHLPSTSQIQAVDRNGETTVVGEWASTYSGNAGLIVDVEFGHRGLLYGLLQGHWDLPPIPDNEGLPAAPNTGELVAVGRDGKFHTVVSGLNQPTSLDFIGQSAFVVTLTGTILRIDGI
jgi:hypothetical protein